MEHAPSQLLEIAGPPLVAEPLLRPTRSALCDSRLLTDWCKLLGAKNGFCCFEGALHVFPSPAGGIHLGLDDWNFPRLWRAAYEGLDGDILFVAEDIFGNQFGLVEDYLCTFDAETAEIKKFGGSVEEWSDLILTDFNLHTGHPIANEWQMQYGALVAGKRLVPKVPFVLGGEFGLGNLFACDAASGMRARGNLAKQLVDVPDGTEIHYSIVD